MPCKGLHGSFTFDCHRQSNLTFSHVARCLSLYQFIGVGAPTPASNDRKMDITDQLIGVGISGTIAIGFEGVDAFFEFEFLVAHHGI